MNNKIMFALEHTTYKDGILFENWPNGIYTDELLFNEFILDNEKLRNDNLFHCGNVKTMEDLKKSADQDAQSMYLKLFCSLLYHEYGNFKDIYMNNGLADYKNLNDIGKDEKYIFPIEIHGGQYWQLPIFLNKGISLPSRVIHDARDGKCKILFHQGGEGQGYNASQIKPFLEAQSKIFNISMSSFGFLDDNTETPELQSTYGSKGFFIPWWYDFSNQPSEEYVRTRMNQLGEPSSRDFYFLCLNRRVCVHRAIIAINIFNRWSDKINWSFDKPTISLNLKELTNNKWSVEEFYNILPKTIDIDLSYNDIQINYELMDTAYINLVTETFFDTDNTIFFSEKTFKPILAIQPFIMIGAAFSLKELKKLGFKTFHPIINEEYDEIVDDNKRMKMILDEINRLYNINEDEMKNLVKSLGQICVYNYNHLIELRKNNIFQKKLSQELYDWVNE
jgi:hypothetical protein